MSDQKQKVPECCGKVVWNTAGGKDFWYCRGCMEEVVPQLCAGLEPRAGYPSNVAITLNMTPPVGAVTLGCGCTLTSICSDCITAALSGIMLPGDP